jgi:transaldolase
MSLQQSIRVNMTRAFRRSKPLPCMPPPRDRKEPVYVSPFVGRLDDQGEDGMGLVRNIKKMYERSDGRIINHLLCSFLLGAELATVPSKVLQGWAAASFPVPDQDFKYKAVDAKGKALKPIPYKELDLDLPWDSFDLTHELTTKGIQKFVADYQSTLRRSA